MKHEIRVVDKERGVVQVTTLDERWYWKNLGTEEKPNYVFVPSDSWVSSAWPKGTAFYKWLANKGWDEAEAIKQQRAEEGDMVHQAIKHLVDLAISGDKSFLKYDSTFKDQNNNERDLTPTEWAAVQSFHDFCWEASPEFIDCERSQVILEGDTPFGGTRDIRCNIKNKKGVVEPWTIDVKTSQNVWKSHEIQVNGYGLFPDGRSDRLGILQVGYQRNKNRWKFTEVDRRSELWAHCYFLWTEEYGNVRPHQIDLPMELSLLETSDKELTAQLKESLKKQQKEKR